MPLDSAYKIALTLGCSVNDLCGWPKGRNKGREFEDDFEAELLRCYRASTPDRQDRILDTARDAAGMSKEMAERHTHEAKQQITADCVEGDTTVFSSNGVANMDEHARLNGERTGGTSTATAASGNPPVANIPEKPRYISAEEACAILSSRGFVDAGTDAALNLLCRVSYQHLSPYIAATSHARGQRSMQQTHDLLMLDRCFQAMAFKLPWSI